jgi:hypothetical protein
MEEMPDSEAKSVINVGMCAFLQLIIRLMSDVVSSSSSASGNLNRRSSSWSSGGAS